MAPQSCRATPAQRGPLTKGLPNVLDDKSTTPGERDVREELAGPAAEAGRTLSGHGVWLAVDDPGFRLPGQGWKIHVSARPSTLLETVRRALPALLARPCHFKIIRSGERLRDLNSSNSHPGSIGKAITVYPAPGDAGRLARALAADLAGLEGPRIVSDKRVAPDAPVYYRYGPFRGAYEVNEDGDLEIVVTDPDGDTHPGAATEKYWQPPWSPDPCAEPVESVPATVTPLRAVPSGDGASGGAADGAGGDAPRVLLGGRYEPVRALTRNAKGQVYRARDVREDRSVIVKEARAYVNEDRLGRDSRLRLRNELYVLGLLSGVEGVPTALDHFRHGDREYLVIDDMGSMALGQEVGERGLYGAGGPRDLRALASALLRILDAAHERGVLVRDLAPTNVVVDDETGRPALVDFEISHAEGPQLFGWTPAYSPPEQERDEPATRECDYYSLGATLFYAATGLAPTWLIGDPRNHDPVRAAEALDGRGGMTEQILGLLDVVPARRAAAAEDIRAGRFTDRPLASTRRAPDRDRLERVVAFSLTETTRYAREVMTSTDFSLGRVGGPINIYRGSSGIGLELLHHVHDDDARDTVRGLAYWTAGFQELRNARPGLYTGSTGTALFLAAAGAALHDEALTAIAAPMGRPPLARISAEDQHTGLAGIGTGQLLLWALTGDESRLDLARGCAERLVARDHTRAVREDPPDYADCGSVSRTLGFSHGVAGSSFFLLDHWAATADEAAGQAAREGYAVLTEHLPGLLRAARDVSAKPMHAAFCQGLAGIGASFVRAARVFGDDAYLEPAREAAAVCHDLAPRMYSLTQCCGLVGLGELFLDLARATGEPEDEQRAWRVAGLLLARSAGTEDAPVFPDSSVNESSGDWSGGTSGILTFLRRLRDPEAPRLLLDPFVLPEPASAGAAAARPAVPADPAPNGAAATPAPRQGQDREAVPG
ncbi:serine/threonine protein kinase [Actinomadura sp. J1-007]|nr:serine/threonine protein kinase [Actinomadura sp. J1-007]